MQNVVILGSGPAGLTAAIYAARADLAPMVIHGPQPGGQLTTTSDVDNWPGYEHGITGPELMEVMKKQAARFGAVYKEGWVDSAELTVNPKVLTLTNGDVIEARAVILATGASAMWLKVPGEEALMGKGVSACATCDGFFFRNKRVVVVGGGDTAMEEATFLTKFASEVVVVHRRDTLRASKAMQAKAMEHPKIRFVWNTEVVEVLGVDAGHVTGVRVRNNQTNEETTIDTDGFFVAIGHKPNTDVFAGQVECDAKGYVVIPDRSSTKTNIDGVFAAGDVADHVYRQAVTAAGTGCMAALDAERWLEG